MQCRFILFTVVNVRLVPEEVVRYLLGLNSQEAQEKKRWGVGGWESTTESDTYTVIIRS